MPKISIMAGNPKVEMDENGQLQIDPQLKAFEEAMKIVSDCRDQISKIVLLFDHPGLFKKQFLDTTLDFGSKKKNKKAFEHLKLSHLLPEIRNAYAPLAAKYGVALDQISVLTEDRCRLIIMSQPMDMENKKRCFSRRIKGRSCDQASCGIPDPDDNEIVEGDKVNCAAITAAAIQTLASGLSPEDKIITCWEHHPLRVNPYIIQRGTTLAFSIFGIKNRVEQHMLFHTPNRTISTTVNYDPENL
ncbi:MAG TPA: hypothetical protein P5229_02985 [Candidatus Gracilibacteria bacterium]|nr:hypothetical protein [Candidatus Gracilibacteria bacterium]